MIGETDFWPGYGSGVQGDGKSHHHGNMRHSLGCGQKRPAAGMEGSVKVRGGLGWDGGRTEIRMDEGWGRDV